MELEYVEVVPSAFVWYRTKWSIRMVSSPKSIQHEICWLRWNCLTYFLALSLYPNVCPYVVWKYRNSDAAPHRLTSSSVIVWLNIAKNQRVTATKNGSRKVSSDKKKCKLSDRKVERETMVYRWANAMDVVSVCIEWKVLVHGLVECNGRANIAGR